jgi:hypothetical protein
MGAWLGTVLAALSLAADQRSDGTKAGDLTHMSSRAHAVLERGLTLREAGQVLCHVSIEQHRAVSEDGSRSDYVMVQDRTCHRLTEAWSTMRCRGRALGHALGR